MGKKRRILIMKDLHIHTYFSDGKNSPVEMIKKLHELGVKEAAITDHDSADTFMSRDFLDLVKRDGKGRFDYKGMKVITGAEIDCQFDEEKFPDWKNPLEILAYGFDEGNEELTSYLKEIKRQRIERLKALIPAVQRRFGENAITEGEIFGNPHTKTYMKPHIVNVLLEKKLIGEYREGNMILKEAEKENPKALRRTTPQNAIKMIHNAGGKAFLAHPFVYDKYGYDDIAEILNTLINKGLDGFEYRYPYELGHRSGSREEIEKAMRKKQDLSRRLAVLFPDAEHVQGSDSHSVEDLEKLHGEKGLWARA